MGHSIWKTEQKPSVTLVCDSELFTHVDDERDAPGDEPPCDKEKRKLCEEYGTDAVLCSGCDCGGDSYDDKGFETEEVSASGDFEKAAEEFSRELFRGFGIAMERMLGTPPEKVIFNGPATIAFWPSGDKVVAKCSGNDEYDREKGLMMCLLKKTYGSKAVDILEEWCEQ